MNVTEKPMNRKERRAAEHAARKAARKRANAEARANAAQPVPAETPAAIMSAAIWTDAQMAVIRAAEREINHLAVGASIAEPPSEPRSLPTVESYKGGPRSESGKQISSQNALKHGSCATSILINPNETMDDFLALQKHWLQSYNPETAGETDLIKAAVQAEWFYLRAERNFADYDNHLGTSHQSPADWTDDEHKTYARFLRYRTANQNILNKSRKAIEDYRKNRQQEAAKTQAMDTAKAKLEIAKTRLTIYQQNHEPDVPFDQLLDNMREKAVRLGFRQSATK